MSQSLSHSLQALKVILLRNAGKLSSLSFFYRPRCMFSLFLLCLPTVLSDQLFAASLTFTSAQITTSPAFVSARTDTWHVLKNMKGSLHFLTCEPNHGACLFGLLIVILAALFILRMRFQGGKTLFCLFVNTRLVFIFPKDAVNKRRQDESKAKQRADNTNVTRLLYISYILYVMCASVFS